jgi:hypothetical protein
MTLQNIFFLRNFCKQRYESGSGPGLLQGPSKFRPVLSATLMATGGQRKNPPPPLTILCHTYTEVITKLWIKRTFARPHLIHFSVHNTHSV